LKALVKWYERDINKFLQGFLEEDLLHPSQEKEQTKHKLKRLVPTPNSYFMDVKCPGCYKM
jgi:hypothetical protein